MREIINIFRRAGKMYELTDRFEFSITGNRLFNKVFDRLNIVVGGPFDLFDPRGLIKTEISYQLLEQVIGCIRERRHFHNTRMLRKILQPANLNHHSVTNQSIFTEDTAKTFSFTAVAAINWRNSGQFRERGEGHFRSIEVGGLSRA